MSIKKRTLLTFSGRGCPEGFTLLELLVSMVLLGIIVGVVAGSMRIGYSSIEKGEKKIEMLERFKVSVALIKSQLESQIPLTRIEETTAKNYFEGDRESLKFTSNYSVWSGHKGFVLVSYRVETDANGKKSLFVQENVVGLENVRETILLAGYDEIAFEYVADSSGLTSASKESSSRGQASKESAGKDSTNKEVSEEWLEDNEVPSQVRVVLRRGKNDFSFAVSLRAKTVTVK